MKIANQKEEIAQGWLIDRLFNADLTVNLGVEVGVAACTCVGEWKLALDGASKQELLVEGVAWEAMLEMEF